MKPCHWRWIVVGLSCTSVFRDTRAGSRPADLQCLVTAADLRAQQAGGQPPLSARRPNHLVGEKSPYLRQHAYNPVDWYPWSNDAFAKARREDKPIFLSIGYSTCHWCHVMEHESFEDDSVAALLNRWFVAIKVDREERPDVDRLYMTAMEAMGLGGGWPLNVFVTPELKPFFGGTYFPRTQQLGRPGLLELLPRVHEAWATQRAELVASGDKVMTAIASLAKPDTGTADMHRLFAEAVAYYERTLDPAHGGFGSAPKFPTPSNLSLLLRLCLRDPTWRAKGLAMVEGQLGAMRRGGIHDQLGGGFHRYSTDERWLVPHFEKMLYDQAQLAWAYLDAYQVARREEYASTVRDILDYVDRDLSSPLGAFDSAEDADSQGEEGAFYLWTPAQIEAAVQPSEANLLEYAMGVTSTGNFAGQRTILSQVYALGEVARHFHTTPTEAARRLEQARAALLEARSRRVRPPRDDKVVTAWNGLMISAFARAARVLDEPRYAARATRAANFLWSELRDSATGALRRRWRDGEAADAGQLSDYADYALGLVDLYQATLDPLWLSRAKLVTEAALARFWDPKEGGLFESPDDAAVAVRMREYFDGAELAGSSVAAYDLVLLGRLLDREEWLRKAHTLLDQYARRLASGPAAMPWMLIAMDLEQSVPRHVVVAGDPGRRDAAAMLQAFNRRFLPHDLLLLKPPGNESLGRLAPFTLPLEELGGRATAYVCVNYACRLPTTDLRVFENSLDSAPEPGVKAVRK